MAKIWFVREGRQPTLGDPIEKSLKWCIEKLGLQKSDWKSSKPPENESTKPHLDSYRPFTAVDVEVSDDDVVSMLGWKTGFYRLSLPLQEVRRRIDED